MSHIEEKYSLESLSGYLDLIRSYGYSKDTIETILSDLTPYSQDYPIKVEITSDGYPAFFNAYYNKIHISEGPLKDYVLGLVNEIIKLYPNLEKQKEELFAYTTFFTLCHEIEHTYQYMFGQKYTAPPYQVVSDAYRKMIELKDEKMSLLKFKILLNRYKSQKNKAHFVLERNANVEAYDLLLKLSRYESNSELEKLMYNQWMGYSACGYASLKNNGPFEESFKSTWRREKFRELDFSEDISVSERIRYGLPIEESDRIVLLKNLIATKSTTYK